MVPFVYMSVGDLVASQNSFAQFVSAVKCGCSHTFQDLLGGFGGVLELPCTGVHKATEIFRNFVRWSLNVLEA